jgi:MFS family permease
VEIAWIVLHRGANGPLNISPSKPAVETNITKFYVATFFGSLSFATGFLVFYCRKLGFSFSQIFLVSVVYEVLNFLLEIPTGVLADFWSRKRVIISGTLISGLSFFVVSIRPEAYVTYIIWSVLSAICTTLNSGSVDAFIYDTVQAINPDEYPKVVGRISAIALTTQAISLPIGGWLTNLYGFRYALVLSGIAGVLQALIISSTVEIPGVNRKEAVQFHSVRGIAQQFNEQIRTSFSILFGQTIVRSVLLYGILFFVVAEFATVIYQPYYSDLGYDSETAIAIFSASFLVIQAISSMIAGHIATPKNQRVLLAAVSAGLCLPLLVLRFAPLGIPSFVLFYFAMGVGEVVLSNTMNGLIPSDKRATILSAQNQLASITYAIAALAMGPLFDRLDVTGGAFAVGAVVLVLFVLVMSRANLKEAAE